MKTLFASVFVLSAVPALAGSPFKTAVVGSEPTLICSSKASIQQYELNRVVNPVKASVSVAKCATLAAGSKVDVIYIFASDLIGDHIVQVRAAGADKLGYALTSGFVITQEVVSR
jgi:hypothetical protein